VDGEKAQRERAGQPVQARPQGPLGHGHRPRPRRRGEEQLDSEWQRVRQLAGDRESGPLGEPARARATEALQVTDAGRVRALARSRR